MDRVVLPFDLAPLLKTYHILAHPLGILGGVYPDKNSWFPWLCHKYINCSFTDHPFFLNVYSTDYYFSNDNTFELFEITLPGAGWEDIFEDTLNISKEKFIEILKEVLLKGRYIAGIYNEKYIKAKDYFNVKDFAHDYLIYGYDDKLESFISAGYTSTGFYESFHISYDEFYNSIFKSDIKSLSLKMVKCRQHKEFKTNFYVLQRDLNHYVNSTAFNGVNSTEIAYGLKAWYKLIDYIDCTETIGLRFVRLFMEHRRLMYLRLEYLSKQGYIDNLLIEQYIESTKHAEKCYWFSIKYNLTKKEQHKDKCIRLIREAINIDKFVLPLVINQLKNCG